MGTERDTIGRLINALRLFNRMDTKMQVSTILTFLEVAAADLDKRDLSMRELEKRIGFTSGVASRNAYYWGEGTKEMRGGRQLIDVRMSRQDHRLRDLVLTNKGRAFLHTLIGEDNGAATREEVPG